MNEKSSARSQGSHSRSHEGHRRFGIYDIFYSDFDDRSRIASRTAAPDLPFRSRQDVQLAHLRYGKSKFLEEKILVGSELFDDFSGLRVGVKILVGGEEALALHEVYVIVVVEDVGRANV